MRAFADAISQTSLEQIFNGFAGQQEEETGAVRGMGQQPMAVAQPQPVPGLPIPIPEAPASIASSAQP